MSVRKISRGGEAVKVTRAEHNLLVFFLQNVDQPLNRDAILNAVWGYDSYPTTRTVDVHVARLRHKLEPNPARPRHFLTIHGVGYRFLLSSLAFSLAAAAAAPGVRSDNRA